MQRERKVGLFLATMLVASSMVGSGIFLLPATLAQFGSMTTLGWLVAAGGALVIAEVLGRLGGPAPEAGGAIAYAGRALGPYVGFQAASVYWVSCWVGNVAIAVAAVGYLASLAPALSGALPLALAAVGLIWALTVVNLRGARLVCQLETAALAAGVIPIALVVGAGWWHFRAAIFLQSWNVSGRPMAAALPPAMVLMFWAFAGVESASIATAVVLNPARNVARATRYGVLMAAAIYLAACGVIMGLIPARELAASTAPFADAVRLIFGPAAGALVAALALAKAVGSLGAWILITAQTGEAAAMQGHFPAFFARRGPGNVPRSNLMLVAALMSAGVAMSAAPTLGEQFGELISVSVLLSLLLYIYACLAMWSRWAHARGLGTRRDRALAAAGIAFCVAVMALSGVRLVALAAVPVALTVPLYPYVRRRAVAAMTQN
ncbi:MAG: amino acid permease [Terriglobales bacterium]